MSAEELSETLSADPARFYQALITAAVALEVMFPEDLERSALKLEAAGDDDAKRYEVFISDLDLLCHRLGNFYRDLVHYIKTRP